MKTSRWISRRASLLALTALVATARLCAQDVPTSSASTWLASQPRDGFDIDALAAKLTTVDAAFAYVRDQIAYEPYTGIMKGAAGALLTHGGNDFDRALLLAKLLQTQGVEVKLAHGQWSAADAKALLAQVTVAPDAAARLLAALPATAPVATTNFDEKLQIKLFDQHTADRARMIADAEMAQRAIVAAAMPARTKKDSAVSRDHVWVQATIEEKIIDLDPSFPTAKTTQAMTPATETWDVGSVPDENYQTVKFRVMAEFLQAGKLESKEFLAHDFRAADGLMQGIRIAVVPETGPSKQGNYFPLLLVGAEEFDGTNFRLSGAVAAPAESGFGGMFGGFGGSAPVPTTAPVDDPAAPKLARLWVEVICHAPQMPDDVTKRVILDRVQMAGADWKFVEALADDEAVRGLLVQAWDAGLDVGAPHPLAVMEVETKALAAIAPVSSALTEKRALSAGDLPGLPPAFQLWNFFLASGLKHHSLATAAKNVRSIHLRPRIAFLRHGFTLADWTQPGAKRLRYEEGIDLVNAPFAFVGEPTAAAELALRAGLTDTAFEQFALTGTTALNTFPLMAAAAEQKVALKTISQPKQLAAITLPPSIREVLAGELRDGRIVVLPEKPIALNGTHALGWWSLDPATGYVIGKMELGGAQAMIEKAQTEEKVSEWTQTYVKVMGDALKCFEGEVTKAFKADVKAAILGGEGAATPDGATMAKCLRDAACDALKDMITGRLSNAVAEREVKALKDMLINYARSQAIDAAGSAENSGCQAALGGDDE